MIKSVWGSDSGIFSAVRGVMMISTEKHGLLKYLAPKLNGVVSAIQQRCSVRILLEDHLVAKV